MASPPGDCSATCRLGLLCPKRGGRCIVGAQNHAGERVRAAGARAQAKGSGGSNPLSNGDSLPCCAAGWAFAVLPRSIPRGRQAVSAPKRQVRRFAGSRAWLPPLTHKTYCPKLQLGLLCTDGRDLLGNRLHPFQPPHLHPMLGMQTHHEAQLCKDMHAVCAVLVWPQLATNNHVAARGKDPRWGS